MKRISGIFSIPIGVYFCLMVGGLLGNFLLIPLVNAQTSYTQATHMPDHPTVPIQNLSQGVIDSNGRKIFYWVQISDIHINAEKDLERVTFFDQFCDHVNSTIKPAFVISSGDNVDAREETIWMFYAQDENEYRLFNQTLQKYDFNTSFWYNMLGNHERYDTELNFSLFQTYLRNETQYGVDFNPGFGQYRFIMLDTTQQYGAKTNFNLLGEMKAGKLNHFKEILSYNNAAGINQTLILGHHPVYEVMSETTPEGKTFQDILTESGAQFFFNGHIHYPDLFVNRGSYTEAECPSFKDRYMYRIAAFDDDIASFSDVDLNHWPQIVVTSPTDARFYNPNMPLERLITHNEIRTLLFDNTSITSAYAEIDGHLVGNLINQGQNLWTVAYSPQNYQTGIHHLTIHAISLHGDAIKELDFELSGFSPTPIEISITWLYFAAPLLIILWIFVIVLAVIGFGRILIPKCLYLIKVRKVKHTELKIGQVVNGHPTTMNRAAFLPTSIILPLFLLFAYPFFGPLLVGQFSSAHLGVAFLNQVFLAEGCFLDLETYFMASIFLFCGVLIESQILRKGEHNTGRRVRGKIRLLASYVILFVFMIFNAVYFGLITIALTPGLYLYGLLPVYLRRQLKKQRNTFVSHPRQASNQL